MAGQYALRVLKRQEAPGMVHGAWQGKALCLGRSRKSGLGAASTEGSRSSCRAVSWVPDLMQGFGLLPAPTISARWGLRAHLKPYSPTPSIP